MPSRRSGEGTAGCLGATAQGSGLTRRRLTGYGDPAFSTYLRGAFAAGRGLTRAAHADRPVVGIADISIDVQSCHASMPMLVQAVERGILQAGGLPLRFPTIALPEVFTYPTSMYLRNLMAMDTEEMLRALPIDAAVLVGGCDKSVPAQLMAAVSVDLPVVSLPVGPMASGAWQDQTLGACTDCRRFWREARGERLDPADLEALQEELVAGPGTCTVMGTASSMAVIAEVLGVTLPGAASAPATSAERLRIAEASGAAAVRAALEDRRPSHYLTPGAFRDALRALLALGGSTNAVIHLTAIARRAGLAFGLDDVDAVGVDTPTLGNLRPHGRYQMAEFHRAGGVALLLDRLAPLLTRGRRRFDGTPLRGPLPRRADETLGRDLMRTLDEPFAPGAGIRVVRGSLAPDGAVIKPYAAAPGLLRHRGPAVVFDSLTHLAERIDRVAVTPDSVLVLRHAGLVGAPGMPEAGWLPIPRSLARAGISDMVRISDARMSGTANGAVVLHVAPEAAVGGPLGLVRDGDVIELDAPAGRLDILVPTDELAARAPSQPPPLPERGYARLFASHVLGPDQGADLDFLVPPPRNAGKRGSKASRPTDPVG
ncbi:IlvD/Edd family dehydratase [soil metagenome]